MTRILTAAVLVPAVVGAVLWAPSWLFLSVLALVGVGAFHEYDAIAGSRAGWLGMVAGLAFLVMPEPALAGLVAIAALFLAAQMRAADLATALPRASMALFGIVYIFGAWRCAVLLRDANPHWLMVALLVSWAGDTAAMYAGKAWGRRRLAPRVSPGKTQEGAVASVVAGTLAAVIYGYYLLPFESMQRMVLIGAAANIAGQLGDLCESAFKRGAQVKDSGTMLPGHGGWLDRIDSSLFSVPAVYGLLRVLQ